MTSPAPEEKEGLDFIRRIVEDHIGNPLASVEVRVYRIGQPTLAAELDTDGEGRFRAPGLPDGEYRIEANLSGWTQEQFTDAELSELARLAHPLMRGEIPASVRIRLRP